MAKSRRNDEGGEESSAEDEGAELSARGEKEFEDFAAGGTRDLLAERSQAGEAHGQQEDRIAALQRRTRIAEDESAQKAQRLLEALEDLQKKKAELLQAQLKIVESQEKVTQAHALFGKSQADLAVAQDENEKLRQEAEASSQKAAKAEEELKAANNRLSQLASDIDAKRSELEGLKKREAELTRKLAEAKTQIESFKDAYEKYRENMADVGQLTTENRHREEAFRAQILSLTKELEEEKKRGAALSQDAEESHGEVVSLKKQLEDARRMTPVPPPPSAPTTVSVETPGGWNKRLMALGGVALALVLILLCLIAWGVWKNGRDPKPSQQAAEPANGSASFTPVSPDEGEKTQEEQQKFEALAKDFSKLKQEHTSARTKLEGQIKAQKQELAAKSARVSELESALECKTNRVEELEAHECDHSLCNNVDVNVWMERSVHDTVVQGYAEQVASLKEKLSRQVAPQSAGSYPLLWDLLRGYDRKHDLVRSLNRFAQESANADFKEAGDNLVRVLQELYRAGYPRKCYYVAVNLGGACEEHQK